MLDNATHGETISDSQPPNPLNLSTTVYDHTMLLLLRLYYLSLPTRCILLHAEENGQRLDARFGVYDTSSLGKIEANELEEGIYSMGVR